MKVSLNNTFQVDEPIDKVWAFLSDPYKVAPCMPGAEITEQVGDADFRGAMKMKLGPFSAQFKGEIRIEKMDAQNHEIRMVGKGRDTRGTGNASMALSGRLKALPEGGTEVISESEVDVGGKLAQFGSRMMQDVSKSMFNQFVSNFTERIKGGEESWSRPGSAVNVSEVAGTAIRGAVGRWFGDKGEDEGNS